MFERFFSSNKNDLKASDLYYIMQANQSIMEEIVLKKLLLKLLSTTIEMSKATKCAIVIVRENDLKIAAIGTTKPTMQIDLPSLSLQATNLLPISIIEQASRSQQLIWLKSVERFRDFYDDPYIQENQPKTVFCLPIFGKQNKFIALLYLENNLIVDAFKAKTVSILKLILISAGLCIENAQLYQQVENYSDSLKDTVQKLKSSQKVSRGQTEVLTNTLDILNREPELDKLIEIVLSSISVQLNSTTSVVCLYDAHKDTISHYMSYQSNSEFNSPQKLQLKYPKTYYQVSKHPFWSKLIKLTEPLSLQVNPSDISDTELFQSLDNQGIKTVLMLPLLEENQLLGLLGIYSTSSQDFPADKIELATALAKQTSLAIKLTNLATRNRSTAIFKERNRLACEIHDTLAQTFTGISIQVGVAERLIDQKPADAKNLINQIGELARAGIVEARRSVWALSPETLESNELPVALSQLLAAMTANLDLKTEFNLQGVPIILDSKVSLNLLRIGQEALTNSLKHSQADQIWIDLIFEKDRVNLSLRDNGSGFNLQQKKNNSGFGLIGMRQRAEQLNSTLVINSSSAKGTEISIEVDLSDSLNSTG